jgi:hypothetical protein
MKTVKSGKKIVMTIITVLLLTIIITIVSTVVNGQADEMGSRTFFGLVRFAIIGSILYFLYTGNKVAKWLMVIITLYSGITGFLASLLAFNRAPLAINITNMALQIIYIAIGIVLIVSSPVNNFLRYQRGEYKDGSNDYKSEN